MITVRHKYVTYDDVCTYSMFKFHMIPSFALYTQGVLMAPLVECMYV